MSDTNGGSMQDSACVNWTAALEAAAGDESLLAELVEMFANTEAPSLIADIDRSITALDPVLLQRAAHTLKGSLRIFESQDASELCLQLETLGKEQLRKITADRMRAEGKAEPQDAESGQLEKLGKQYAADLEPEDRQRTAGAGHASGS